MIHKFKNKKGNLTALLVMIIAFMIMMTAILAKRMSSHTQLLTLSDYTQISRYFLESYMGEVMQKIRHEVNQPNSALAQEICKNIEEVNSNLTPLLHYSPSDDLKELARSYSTGQNELKIKESEFKIELIDQNDGNDDNDIGALPYPEKINPGENQKGKEKKGVIQITCKCEFMKREYTLVVQYPFTVVYRMTPILKDFILFVDNMYDEQNEYNPNYYSNGNRTPNKNMDTINILSIKRGQILDDVIPEHIQHPCFELKNISTLDSFYDRDKFRPFTLQLFDDGNGDHIDRAKRSGMVYFGPTDVSLKNSIFLNLAGTTLYPDDSESLKKYFSCNDIFIVNSQYFDMGLDGITKQDFGLGNKFQAYLAEYPLLTMDNRDSQNQWLKFGYVGFSNEMPELFDGSGRSLEEFLGNDENVIKNTFWGETHKNPDEFIKYSSGLKPFGVSINEDLMNLTFPPGKRFDPNKDLGSPTRQIFGNVFGRFFVFSFYNAHDGAQIPLEYLPSSTISEYNEEHRPDYWEHSLLGSLNDLREDEERKTMYDLRPKYPEGLSEYEQDRFYQKLMSKIISGMPACDQNNNYNYLKNGDGSHQYLFMPLNVEYDDNEYDKQFKNMLYDERDFKPNDGFELGQRSDDIRNDNAYHFHDFGKDWFNPTEDNASAAVEARIGRSFIDSFDGSKSAQEKFKEAVGYPDKFIINGVVYVGGDLDLSEKDMDLKPGDCSGGVVLVDGNITLPNITRGDEAKNLDLTYNNVLEYYQKWTTPDPNQNTNRYIATDSIITFVCLKNPNKPDPKITIKGNILLGVQLINLSNAKTTTDQICWNLKDKTKEILLYGSIVCNKLFLPNRLKEFGEIEREVKDDDINMPFFIYPPVMADKDPPLAVQIMENMRSYNLTTSVAAATTE